MNRPRIVFINIGWMADYQGPRKNDRTKGGHDYLKEHDGHESYNFKPHRGKLLGYVPGAPNINITKFVGSQADSVTGMTVVWCAMHPELKRHVIVGWYENATIFRKLQKGGPWKIDGLTVEHQIEADEKHSHRVPRELRTFPGPGGPRIGFGRSVIYYGNEALWAAVPEFIRSKGLRQIGSAKPRPRNGRGWQQDAEKRKRIERAAVEHAEKYYRDQLQDPDCVRSVEHECLGWDLEVTLKTNETLLVEVKGTSLPDVCAELTVNEYKKSRMPEHRARYVIYVVTEADTAKKRRRHIFRYRGWNAKHGDIWAADDGRVLEIEELKAARLTVKR